MNYEVFNARLDELERECRFPRGAPFSELNKWCLRVLACEEKLSVIKQYVYQADVDKMEEYARMHERGEIEIARLRAFVLMESEEADRFRERYNRFMMYLDWSVEEFQKYVRDFEQSLEDFQESKKMVLKLGTMHWLKWSV